MARNYNIEKNSTDHLRLAYGNLPIRGTLVRDDPLAVGADLQVTLQMALGEGEWDGVDRLGYKGHIIAPQYYEFFTGAPGEIAARDLFPSDVNHPNAVFINVRLPIGIATDNEPSELIGNYRCLKVNDYDSNGNVIGYGFSRNPARICVDIIRRKRPRLLSKIEWSSWVEWRDWCAYEIATVKNDETIYVPRFELNFFSEFGVPLATQIEYILQQTCTDRQWRNGKLRFMPPIDRPDETFTFDLTQVAPDKYEFIKQDRRNRPNRIVVNWRNFDDAEFYREEEPIIVDRETLIIKDGTPNSYVVDAGVCRRNQAERIAHFYAKTKCDATEYSAVIGSWKSYPMLPADIVQFTHNIPDYEDRRFKIVEKSENETEGLSDDDNKDDSVGGYNYKLQDFPVEAYSDTDQTPLVLHSPNERPNPFAAPPQPTLTVSLMSDLTRQDGTVEKAIKGSVTFGEFGFPQFGKIYWTRPGRSQEFVRDIFPDSNNQASFEIFNLPAGTNWFKVVAFSLLGVPNTAVGGDVSINIEAYNLEGNGRINGHDPLGTYRGRDAAAVPVSALTAKIDSVSINNDDADVLLGISILNLGLDGFGNPIHNQADSVNAIQVDVFNQFGELVKSFSPAAGNPIGGQFVAKFSRKYADPMTGQGYFKIRVKNYFGYSQPIYLKGETVTTTIPTPKVRANCPLDASASPFNANAVQISYTFSLNVNILRRKLDEPTFTTHASGVSSSPYLATGLAEFTEYEFQVVSAADANNKSNIFRVRTKQQAEAAPSRPAPSSATGSIDATNPTSKLNFSCISAANVETEVWVGGSLATTLSAVAVSGTISYSISSLSPNTTRAVKFRHKWGSGDYSDGFTEEIILTTSTPPPSETAPTISFGSYGRTTQQISCSFTPGTGSGNFEVEIGGGVGIPNLSSSATSFTYPVDQYDFGYEIAVRIRRITSSLPNPYSEMYYISIPPLDPRGPFDPSWE